MPKLPEVIFWPERVGGVLDGFKVIVEPDFGFEPPTQEDAPLCEYCGTSKGYPTNLGIHVALLCDECAVFCEDEIVYDIQQGA